MSILPFVSTILERIFRNHVHEYLLQVNCLIYVFQSCFRSTHSNDTALTFIGESLRLNMDDDPYIGMVLFDLQTTFETVD